VAVQLLRHIAERVRPPRALFVPFRHGFPLDHPAHPRRQCLVIDAALKLLEDPGLSPPALVDFDPQSVPDATPCPD
jgi:hypothetical protein